MQVFWVILFLYNKWLLLFRHHIAILTLQWALTRTMAKLLKLALAAVMFSSHPSCCLIKRSIKVFPKYFKIRLLSPHELFWSQLLCSMFLDRTTFFLIDYISLVIMYMQYSHPWKGCRDKNTLVKRYDNKVVVVMR